VLITQVSFYAKGLTKNNKEGAKIVWNLRYFAALREIKSFLITIYQRTPEYPLIPGELDNTAG
jgi:hypothetical protein